MQRYIDECFKEIEMIRDIPFATVPGFIDGEETLTMDLYFPKGDKLNSRRLLMLIHGGGFMLGNDKRQPHVIEIAEDFARRGYVVATPDYRLRTREEVLTQDPDLNVLARFAADDIELCRQFIKERAEKYGIDLKRAAIAGSSAGGKAACVAVTDGAYRCMVNFWGALPVGELKNAEKMCPSLFIHGTIDPKYPNTVDSVRALAEAGTRVEVIPIVGGDHTCIERKPEFIGRMTTFMDEYLRPVEEGLA